MLVPTMRSGRMLRLSITSMTPICASPFAPPPESTSAVPRCEQPCAAAGAERNDATIARAAQLRRKVRSVLVLVFVLAQLRGADGVLAELLAHAIDGARDGAIALRLERCAAVVEQCELRRLRVRRERRERDPDQARGRATTRAQRVKQLARDAVDHPVGHHGLVERAPRLANGEVRILDLHADRACREQLRAHVRCRARHEREQLALEHRVVAHVAGERLLAAHALLLSVTLDVRAVYAAHAIEEPLPLAIAEPADELRQRMF